MLQRNDPSSRDATLVERMNSSGGPQARTAARIRLVQVTVQFLPTTTGREEIDRLNLGTFSMTKGEMRRNLARLSIWFRCSASIASTLAVFAAIGCSWPPKKSAVVETQPGPSTGSSTSGPIDGPIVEQLLDAHNAARRRRRLGPLKLNPELSIAAQSHALDMANRRKMGHKGSDGSSPFDRIDRAGYRYRAAAENVAYGFTDVESVMMGWMKSPGHRRNILDGSLAEMGAGRAIDRNGLSYWCVTFGSPGL